MNQIATLPLPSCQRMSLLPSPLKSPVSLIDQRGDAAEPTPAAPVTCAPFISQIATSPVLVFCQRMSPLPSPLKSAVPAIDHTAGTVPTPADWVTWTPFKNHIATLPLTSRQSRSALP